MACSHCGKTGHKFPTCPQMQEARDLANEDTILATTPGVRILDKPVHGDVVRAVRGVTDKQLHHMFRGRGCE